MYKNWNNYRQEYNLSIYDIEDNFAKAHTGVLVVDKAYALQIVHRT